MNSRSTESFYENLPVLDDFVEVADPTNYTDLPADWQVAVADIENSTGAIEQGRYRDVNLLGASSIIAVINAVKPRKLPYVFGGDGATLCVPDSLVDKARAALQAARHMARIQFGLRLRVGLVPVAHVHEAGVTVAVARYRASPNLVQAAFSGGGIQFAERCVKDDAINRQFILAESDSSATADFSGLECRWDNIKSPHGEIVTLLVQATGTDPSENARIYREAMDAIGRIYGRIDQYRPVMPEELHLSRDLAKMDGEARVHSMRRSPLALRIYRRWLQFQSIIGRFVLDRGLKLGGTDWGRYKRDLIANTDFRKFDDVLRHVLSGTADQRRRLTDFLERSYQQGRLAYGLHTAQAALMTCLIFQRDGDHVHFVDGADGGYALAASELKQRLAARKAAAMAIPG